MWRGPGAWSFKGNLNRLKLAFCFFLLKSGITTALSLNMKIIAFDFNVRNIKFWSVLSLYLDFGSGIDRDDITPS